jgi:hypothetical protein
LNVFRASVICVRNKHDVGIAQKLAMLSAPLKGTTGAASGGHIPARQQIGFRLAFDDHYQMIGGGQLGQAIRHYWGAGDIMNPTAGVIGIGAAPPKHLVGFAVLQDEAAIGLQKLDTIDSKSDAAVLVLILETGGDNLPCCRCPSVAAVRPLVSCRRE